MSLSTSHYGTLAEAQDYFDSRLHEFAWSDAKPVDRTKALVTATRILDTLNYKGNKNTVYQLLIDNGCSTCDPFAAIKAKCITKEELQAAELAQVLEFPRGANTTVPDNIKCATFEIAHSLLDGKDPELELENLDIVSQGFASVRTTYGRNRVPTEHIINFIPSAMAWRLLKPFLRDEDAIRLRRVV